jgi:hypothetical protein
MSQLDLHTIKIAALSCIAATICSRDAASIPQYPG